MNESKSYFEQSGPKSPPPFRPEGRRSFLLFMAFFGFIFACVMIWQFVRLSSAHRNTVGDGVTVESYEYDLSNLTVDPELLVSSGLPKDGQAAISDPTMIAAGDIAEKTRGWSRFVVSDDLVIGLEINGEARAYPLRYLQWHEVVNTTVGGMPVAITYTKLTDSAVVFDRRVGDETLEFGYSGLLYNSNLVMYDNRPGRRSEGESLWSQLKFEAISGPLVGTELKVLPMYFGRWSHWLEAHPDTQVWGGEDPFRQKYNKRHILPGYFRKGELLYPVKPTPPADSQYELMAPVVAERGSTGWDVRPVNHDGALAISSDRPLVHARWFGWYAMHPPKGE